MQLLPIHGDAEDGVVVNQGGDAIDDLADIYGDLEVFDGIWVSRGPDAALAALSATYEAHWGMHLRELQLYLFQRGDRGARSPTSR